jgi:hypothetical protein
LTEKRVKGSLPDKKHHGKKKRIAYSKLRVTMQIREMKAMAMMIGENQSRQSQFHVTVFRGTEG